MDNNILFYALIKTVKINANNTNKGNIIMNRIQNYIEKNKVLFEKINKKGYYYKYAISANEISLGVLFSLKKVINEYIIWME